MSLVMKSVLLLLVLSLTATVSSAAQIVGVRSWGSAESTRLVVELDANSQYHVSADSTPRRLIIQMPSATTGIEGPRWPARAGVLDAMRLDVSERTPRLMLDLNRESDAKVFLLGPSGSYGYRLVIDLTPRGPAPITAPVQSLTPAPVQQAQAVPQFAPIQSAPVQPGTLQAAPIPVPIQAAPMPQPVPQAPQGQAQIQAQVQATTVIEAKPRRSTPGHRDIVITIDPGHGGEDPGAIGRDGHFEKNVTLAIGKATVDYLNRQDGIRAQLTRDSDFFIPLQERRQMARYKHKADIFVSIHADSAPSRQASGASVFALSLKGAGTATSRFAQQLAEQENKSDLIGGVAVESGEVGDMLANLLIEGTLKHSLEMGGMILRKLEPTVGKLHNHQVEQAGFAVLKEPGMVSLLVETGFISNPEEEARLTDPAYQRQLAVAIGDGIVTFCRRFPVPGTYFSKE